MSIRSFLICALGTTASLSAVTYSSAATVVAAQDYGLQVSHQTLATPTLKSGEKGTRFQLSITNRGTHDLSDLRIYLQQIGPKAVVDRQEPARLTALPAGASSTIQWTYDPRIAPGNTLAAHTTGPLRDALFRIEAIDQSTQKIVKVYQKGTEAR